MIAENPLALAYILPADVYLLANEKKELNAHASPVNYRLDEPVNAAVLSEPEVVNVPPTAPVVEAALAGAAQVIQTPVLTFNYAGGNAQRFLILVHYPEHEVMEPVHQSALESTIQRKGLNMNDVAILNMAKHPDTELKALGAFFKPRKMLLLGAGTFPVGLPEPVLNQPCKIGKCDMLYSFSFNQMMGNKENTKAFWEQMKAL